MSQQGSGQRSGEAAIGKELINPSQLAAPHGFSHGIATRGGRLLWLAGQNGTDGDGEIPAPDELVSQCDLALANIIAVVEAAGGKAEDIVKLHFYVSDLDDYRRSRREIGAIWRKHFGRYYPAMMLLGVTGFFEPGALIEIDGYAHIVDAEAEAEELDSDHREAPAGPFEGLA